MPTSDTQITDEFRRAYGQMVDDSPFAPEWEDLWAAALHSQPAARRHPGWMAAVAAAVVALAAIGGVAILAGNSPSNQETVTGADSPTTTLTTPVARMTVVFTPGELSDAEWESFTSVLRNYPSSAGYVPVDDATARQQAVDFFADDPDALDALNEYPHIASGYAHVDFANRDEAFAFQEEVTRLDFVVAAVGENGPHLGRGYVPLADLGTDDLRASFWQHAYSSGGSPQNPGPPVVNEVISGSEEDSHYLVGFDLDGTLCADAGTTIDSTTRSQTVCGVGEGQVAAIAYEGEAAVALAGWATSTAEEVIAIYNGETQRRLELTPIPGHDLYAYGAVETIDVRLIEIRAISDTGTIIERYFPSIGPSTD